MTNGYSEASCSYFAANECRSCTFLGTAPGVRFNKKLGNLREIFRSSRVEPKKFHDPVVSPSPWGTRHKVKMSVTGTVARPIIGVTGPDMNSRDIIGCKLANASIRALLSFIRDLITRYSLAPYDIQQRRGELKFIIAATSSNNDQGILRFVLRSVEAVSRIKKAIPELINAFPWLKVISCNIQPIPAAILEGPEEIILTECQTIRDELAGVPIYFAPQSFMQVTPSIAQQLYQTAASVVAETRPRRVLDLFCGVGGFSLFCASHCGSITGVEISPRAIECATKSVIELELKNANFMVADVEQFTSERFGGNHDLIITNPPRRGLSKSTIEFLIREAPGTILYSSCNPETFCRDATLLNNLYTVEETTPFDMFPMTDHWEILGVLRRR